MLENQSKPKGRNDMDLSQARYSESDGNTLDNVGGTRPSFGKNQRRGGGKGKDQQPWNTAWGTGKGGKNQPQPQPKSGIMPLRKPLWGPCYQCNRIGHTQAHCPELGKGWSGNCTKCRIKGHRAEECPKGKGKGLNEMEKDGETMNLGGAQHKEPEAEADAAQMEQSAHNQHSVGPYDQHHWDPASPWGEQPSYVLLRNEVKTLGNLAPLTPKQDDPEWQWIEGIMDSGAADMVIHEDLLSGYDVKQTEASRLGMTYTSASKDKIINKGEVDLLAYTDDGLPLRMTMQAVNKLNKTLLSMRRIEQAGNRVVIGSDEPGWPCYVQNKKSGIRSKIGVRDGVYTYGFWIRKTKPPEGDNWQKVAASRKSNSAAPFTGPAKK